MSSLRLYLASASPRRLTLLRELGLDPLTHACAVDERLRSGEAPAAAVCRLAELKGRTAAAALGREALVLAADTVVVVDDRCLGKPASRQQAAAMLRRLRGRRHQVLTGVFLLRTDDGRSACEVEATTVRFRAYDDATIAAYVASGEADDKAGAYGIQGRGVLLARDIAGSWSNVVGLPLERLPDWLESIDVDLWSLLPPPEPQGGLQSPSDAS